MARAYVCGECTGKRLAEVVIKGERKFARHLTDGNHQSSNADLGKELLGKLRFNKKQNRLGKQVSAVVNFKHRHGI